MITINNRMKSSAAALAFFLSSVAWACDLEQETDPAVSFDAPAAAKERGGLDNPQSVIKPEADITTV